MTTLRPSNYQWIERVGIAALALLSLFIIWVPSDSFFDYWSDRDMLRTFHLFNEFQWSGAELSFGTAARVPGGFLHYVWAIPMLFSDNPVVAYRFSVLLAVLSLIPFFYILRKHFGVITAIVATAILLCSPIFYSNVTRLWNPGFQAAFVVLAFTLLIQYLVEDKRQNFKWIVACIAVAMQMHFSVALMFVPLIFVLVALWRLPPLKEWLLAGLFILLLLSTYIIGEAIHDFPNTRALLGSQGHDTIRDFGHATLPLNLVNFAGLLGWFTSNFPKFDANPTPWEDIGAGFVAVNLLVFIALGYVMVAIVRWLEWGKPLTARFNLPAGSHYGQVTFACVSFLVIGLIYLVYSPHIELWRYYSGRYIFFMLPPLAVVTGLAAGALHTLAQRKRGFEIAALILIFLGTATQMAAAGYTWHRLDFSKDIAIGRYFIRGLDVVEKVTGWPREDVFARTTVLRDHRPQDDSWAITVLFPIAYELHLEGIEAPFAQYSPCAVVIPQGKKVYGEKGIDGGVLKRSFAQPFTDVKILKQQLVDEHLVVVYERPKGHCLSSIGNRYISTSAEKITEKLYGTIPQGQVIKVDDGDNVSFVANIDDVIYALIRLHMVDGQLVAELHSNQLRGEAYNGGFLNPGMVEAPRLRLGKKMIEFDPGLVGSHGVMTPIRQQTSLGEGKYTAAFEADVYSGILHANWPIDLNTKKPVTVTMPGTIILENGQLRYDEN